MLRQSVSAGSGATQRSSLPWITMARSPRSRRRSALGGMCSTLSTCRPTRFADVLLELRKVLAGVHAMHRDRQMSPHPFAELDLGRRIKPPRANEVERQGREEN